MKLAIFQNIKFGGSLRASHEIARGLVEQGHELHLFSYEFDPTIPDLYGIEKDQGISLDFSGIARLHPLPDPRPHRRMNSHASVSWRLGEAFKTLMLLSDLKAFDIRARIDAAAIDGLNCDAILLHACIFTNVPLILKYLKTPTCWFCQEPTRNLFENHDCISDAGKGFFERKYRKVRRNLEIIAARSAKKVLCNSHFSREFIYRAFNCEAVFCRLCVNVDTFIADEQVEKENSVICWGPLWPSKRLDFIVRSVGLIPPGQRPKVQFPWSRGSPVYHEELTALAKQLGVELYMPRNLDDEHLIELIRKSKICVYAARMEPLGLVPLEAMSAGLPVIGVCEGGIRETIVHGITGYLCALNEKEFSIKVAKLIKDKQLCSRMGQEAASYVRRHWTRKITTEQVEEQLCKLVRKAGS